MSIATYIRRLFKQAQDFSLIALVSPYQAGRPAPRDVSYEAIARRYVMTNPVLYGALRYKAQAAAGVGFILTKDGEVVEEGELYELLRRPNPLHTFADFMFITQLSLDIAGVAYWQKVRAGNRVVALYPLRPDRVKPIPDPQRVIAEYAVSPPDSGETIRLPAEDVLDIRLAHPLDLWRGLSPLRSVLGDLETARLLDEFVSDFFENGGVPPFVLKVKFSVTPERAKEILNKWSETYGGARHWSKPALLDEDADIQPIGQSFEDIGLDSLIDRLELRICSALGVPPILVGTRFGLERSTYSNYAEARRAFWEDTMTPVITQIFEELNIDLLPEFGEGWNIEPDWSSVPAFQDDDFAWAARAFQAGVITLNEARAAIGLPPVVDGDRFYRPVNLVPEGAELVDGGGDEEEKARRRPEEGHRSRWERRMEQELFDELDRAHRELLRELREKGPRGVEVE